MYEKILVPVDGSAASAAALSEAVKIAKNQNGQIRLMHVVNDLILDYSYGAGVFSLDALDALKKAGRSILDGAESMVRREGVKAGSVLLESVGGRAADLILAQAGSWGADLVVMGTHGRRGLARLVMGSDAEAVVRASTVPVLLLRGTGQAAAPSGSR